LISKQQEQLIELKAYFEKYKITPPKPATIVSPSSPPGTRKAYTAPSSKKYGEKIIFGKGNKTVTQ